MKSDAGAGKSLPEKTGNLHSGPSSVHNVNIFTSFQEKHYFLIGWRMNANKFLEVTYKHGKKVFSCLPQTYLLCFWKYSEDIPIICLPWSTARQMSRSRQNLGFNWCITLAFSLQFLPALFNNCTCVTIWKNFRSLMPHKRFSSRHFAMAHFPTSPPYCVLMWI